MRGVQAAEPRGEQAVPARDHREPSHRRKGDADLGHAHRQRHHDRDRDEGRGDAERAEAGAKHLRQRPDEVDLVPRDVGHHRRGAEDEEQGDERRGVVHRLLHRAGGRMRFAGQNGHVLEAGKRADAHLAEHVEIEQRERRHLGAERMVGREMSGREAEVGEQDEHGEDRDHEHAAGIVDPLGERQADERQPGEERDRESGCQGHEPRAVGHPRGVRAQRIREVGRDGEAQLRGEQDHVQPQIPGDHEADRLVEAEFRPLVEATLERHQLVEPDDHGGQRQVEQDHGGQPQHHV